MSSVRLHRCPFTFLKVSGHGCHNVQLALEEAGIDHEVVKVPALPRSRRTEVERLTGQTMVPVIEFEDGSAWRAESAEIVAAIEAGTLFEHAGTGTA
jgi:glutathione S-transferase